MFSIIIPCYNVEKYLAECVDSILAQTVGTFEVILVNDGSKDGTGAICDAYAAKDSRIRVIHKENGGQSSARNMGTAVAKGDYIIYIDSDDFIMDRDFLQKMTEAAGPDIIFYKHKKFDDETKQLSSCTYSFAGFGEGAYFDTLKAMIAADAFYGMAWNKCIKASVIRDNNIRFDESLSCEDMDWIYYVILSSSSLTLVDEPFVAYRQRANSVTSAPKFKSLQDFVLILEKWYEKAQSSDCTPQQKQIVLSSLAKYYSNLLIAYTRIKDKRKHTYNRRLKKLSRLLQFGLSKRPRLVGKIYRLAGFKLTTTALKVLDRVK
ncbi:MAG: glycosyltransferase family 2 protein [Oscillospiraceae bacterium]|nr:glycosyltransferase family 2 protein [Oscillospiraceae bacterium]